jgi:WD40 repeat protein/serine/threonine protein kinase
MKPDIPSSGSTKPIFVAAQRLTDPDERRAYLDEACGDDLEMRSKVESLLVAFDGGSSNPLDDAVELGRTETAAAGTAAECETINVSYHPMIGPYKLLEQLGEGGMGTVYMAQQKVPVKRSVALKLIKPGMDSKEVIARFEAERQALAMMNHANIARIFDAGMTEQGRPYFVMELVRGTRIDHFCDEAKLTLKGRLQLFIDVCRAIQHAHQKGIIHRDLKPSNILVTLHDGVPVVKVIDFGIAKALDHDLTDRTLFTQYAELIGTPSYMSPEQAEMSGLDIDTRSDVYSLGVLLYKLLTGVTPFDKKTLNSSSLEEMRRIIREDEPLRPSTRVSTLKAEQLSPVFDQLEIDVRKYSHTLRGELDWIVMQALEKDRARRYESAGAFAADIERYLNDEPVAAFPPSSVYRMKKLARRNKAIIVTAGLVGAALIMGTTVSVWQASEANAARRLADQRFLEADQERKNAERAAKQAQQNEEFSRQLVYAADVTLAAQAWQTGDVRRFTDLLDRHAQIAGKPDRRGFEWWYLRQFGMAGFRNIATQTGGTSVARFSPNGNYLVTGQYDGTVCFRDGENDKLLATLRGHEGLVRGIDFAPDGNRMATIGDDGMIRLWDPAEQKQIRSFQAHPGHGFRVFFVMDGQVLASCGEDSSVRLWDASTGEALGALKDYARTVERAAMDRSPDGRLCVSGDPGGYAYVWDVRTHKRLCKLDLGRRDGDRCYAACVCFSPDGKLVAVGTDENLIRVCDVGTGKQVVTFTGHEDDIQDVTFHPSGRLLASSDMAGVIRVWPLDSVTQASGHESGRTDKWPPYFQGHSSRAWSLAFSPDGTRLVSASRDGHVRSWSGRPPSQQHVRETGDETNAMTFACQGRELIIAGNNSIRTWHRQADEIRPFGEAFTEHALCVAVSPDGGTCVTGHAAGVIRFWNRETGRLERTLTGHSESVDQIAFSPDGLMLATGSWDGTAKLRDTASGKQLAVFDMPPHCYGVVFSPDGRLLACSSQNDAMLFDVASRKRLHLLLGHQNTADCVAFSPDGRMLATGSHDRTIRIWNVDTGIVQHVIAAHRNSIHSLAFSPDGRTIASGDARGTISFSHVETGRFLFETNVGHDRVYWVQFSPDGERLAAAVSKKGVILLHAPRIETDERLAAEDAEG